MASSAGKPVELPRKRVLLVEDDEELVRMIARVLGAQFDVLVARDGMEGLSMAQTSPHPDLIVTDVMMPRLDGVAMVAHLRKSTQSSRIPVIFLTAKGGPRDVIAGIAVGARHYLTKPFKVDELLQKVRKALGTI
jgi:DNA-binding response OmpR family regulator